jgi:hypothetical protein
VLGNQPWVQIPPPPPKKVQVIVGATACGALTDVLSSVPTGVKSGDQLVSAEDNAAVEMIERAPCVGQDGVATFWQRSRHSCDQQNVWRSRQKPGDRAHCTSQLSCNDRDMLLISNAFGRSRRRHIDHCTSQPSCNDRDLFVASKGLSGRAAGPVIAHTAPRRWSYRGSSHGEPDPRRGASAW